MGETSQGMSSLRLWPSWPVVDPVFGSFLMADTPGCGVGLRWVVAGDVLVRGVASVPGQQKTPWPFRLRRLRTNAMWRSPSGKEEFRGGGGEHDVVYGGRC